MATSGHYCRKSESLDGNGEKVYHILAGTDPGKDQSYFLCQLDQEQLSRAMFPIGDLLKSEVRAIAREADLPSADKKDSQGICFVGKVDLPVFLQQKLKSVEGEVIEVFENYYPDNALYCLQQSILEKGEPYSDQELETLATALDYSDLHFETETYRSGKKHIKKTRYKAHPYACVAGKHEGAQFFTIGQRKGLAIGGHQRPIFVIGTDISLNRVYVGEGENHPGLMRKCLKIKQEDIHWIVPSQRMEIGEQRKYEVRIRYRQPLQKATLMMRSEALYIVFDTPQRSITPGQFAVWYAPDGEMIGSGVI